MSSTNNNDPFDYVIIGAGTAGCVLANRLSVDRRSRICLIEAGPADTYLPIHVPPLIGMAIQNPRLNWGYSTAPQRHLDGRSVIIPRGRVLGGSSSINGMVYFRGHPGDFDDWAAAGNPGWRYEDVLPYFLRSENNEAYVDSVYHGVGGPMNVVSIARPNPLVHRFIEATTALNLPVNADFNAADPDGFGTRQANIRHGRRVSAATAFLNPAKHRRNLTVLTHAHVSRILVENRKAIGVDLQIHGVGRRILARREVILCAGTYASPAILLRSGIGDGEALSELGIEVAHHLPEVGRNLRDHPSAEVRVRLHLARASPQPLESHRIRLVSPRPDQRQRVRGHGVHPQPARPATSGSAAGVHAGRPLPETPAAGARVRHHFHRQPSEESWHGHARVAGSRRRTPHRSKLPGSSR
jgi:choline dehydrogenase-like flavoprotein